MLTGQNLRTKFPDLLQELVMPILRFRHIYHPAMVKFSLSQMFGPEDVLSVMGVAFDIFFEVCSPNLYRLKARNNEWVGFLAITDAIVVMHKDIAPDASR